MDSISLIVVAGGAVGWKLQASAEFHFLKNWCDMKEVYQLTGEILFSNLKVKNEDGV